MSAVGREPRFPGTPKVVLGVARLLTRTAANGHRCELTLPARSRLSRICPEADIASDGNPNHAFRDDSQEGK